jgi:hypothetical protein
MRWVLRLSRRDAVRGAVAGSQGVAASSAAHALFQAGGRSLLPAPIQGAVRGAVESEASHLLVGVGLLEASASTTARMIESGTVRAAAVQTVRAASRQIMRSVSVAAGAGAVIDGGWAMARVIRDVRRGAMTRGEAAAHVAREATTGALATAAGAAGAALIVTLTGGIAAPAVFLVAAATSAGAKAGLDSWLSARARGAIKAHVVPATP